MDKTIHNIFFLPIKRTNAYLKFKFHVSFLEESTKNITNPTKQIKSILRDIQLTQLVLLGGPPGVGKSTILKSPYLNTFRCLEADDIWKPNTIGSRQEAITQVIQAVEKYLNGTNTVILSWVFARSELYTPFYNYFTDLASLQSIYLVCDSRALISRLKARDTAAQEQYALEKLKLIQALPFQKIDTTDKVPSSIAQILINRIQVSL